MSQELVKCHWPNDSASKGDHPEPTALKPSWKKINRERAKRQIDKRSGGFDKVHEFGRICSENQIGLHSVLHPCGRVSSTKVFIQKLNA
jgi:hypothetical protein